MNERTWRGLPSLLLVAIVAACSAAAPSGTIGPTASTAALATPAAASTPAPTAAPTPTPSTTLGGGPILIWQLDGTSPETATTETVYTLDVGTGAKTVLGTLPVTEETCCPSEVRVSADRARAFLFSNRIRAIVDLKAGSIDGLSTRAPTWPTISNRGDRLAWVDDMTGTSESIIVADLAGKELRRLALPEGAWQSTLAWSPDDSTLAVTTLVPLRTGRASGIRLASIIACCTVDRGPEVTHLLVVPLDGSPFREVLNDAAEVVKDQLVPIPSKPPNVEGDTPKVQRTLGPATWSPDGRSVLLPGSVCPPSWGYRYSAWPCSSSLRTVDVETGASTIIAEDEGQTATVSWSPDSRRVAFVRWIVRDRQPGSAQRSSYEGELVVVDADGRNRLSLGDAEGGGLSWSPDGAWIAYWRINPAIPEGQNRVEVWVSRANGDDARMIAAHAAAGW